jgi:hypothetical protein
MEWTRGEYRISTDQSFLSVEKIHALLLRSYWALPPAAGDDPQVDRGIPVLRTLLA